MDNNIFFSVVSAAHNSALWIDHYFSSIIKQTLNFSKYIQVIIVDDGSTDQTLAIAKSWKNKYPRNIEILCKKNEGPASARNLGLQHAQGNWITFIDPDDFICDTYFETVKNFLESTTFDGNVIACNLVLYHEAINKVSNTHPLNYRFKKDNQIINVLDHPEYIQLSGATAFFRKSLLDEHKIFFDERVKPTFEDANFINKFFLISQNFEIAFLKNAIYFYRKRSKPTSLIDTVWYKKEKYFDQIYYGCYPLIKLSIKKYGYVLPFLQNIMIYEFFWYIKNIYEDNIPYIFHNDECDTFIDLIKNIFKHIEITQVLSINIPIISLKYRIIMLCFFKNFDSDEFPVFIDEISADRNELAVTLFSCQEKNILASCNGSLIASKANKTIHHVFNEKTICVEQRHWFPLHSDASTTFTVNDTPVQAICGNLSAKDIFQKDIIRNIYASTEYLPEKAQQIFSSAENSFGNKFQKCWVLMDRVHKADDNAEHLCRWLLKNHPEQPVFFVLERKSKDWVRLDREGFPLLAYGSKDHFAALTKAEWLISSHVDIPVTDPMGTRTIFGVPSYKTAFLQHGIIMHDLSRWLNQFSIDFMVTSVQAEYESLITGKYKFTTREVVLTGLPRHDALLFKTKTKKPNRTILVCPTWREHLRSTEAHVPGLKNDEAHTFQKSDYFRNWNAVTASQSLAQLADDHGFRLLFLPHPEIVRFLPLFQRSKAFSFLSWTDLKSVQDLLATCSMAITDYSSFAFEMGYIGRPVAYYQFPESPDFISTQVKPGYFSYEKHGLGPVLRTREALEEWINKIFQQGCVRQEPYNSRADAFFTWRDGHNCQRVYDAIISRSHNIKTQQ
jgi:glycosyltransferase involved in cell wall biosynthesis